MQFHLDGFRPGDPNVFDPAEGRVPQPPSDEVDVLIVGCGPTGLTVAAQLAAFADIRTRIIDQKAGPLQIGQADGVACRSMETYEAFGFAERVLKEAYWVNETSFWKPDEANRARIVRGGRIQDTEDDLSEFPHVILNQARIHDFLLETMRNGPARLEPTYDRRLAALTVEAGEDHPVTVAVERLDRGGEVETIRARYVVGCDGARSAGRTAIGQTLRGDSANQAWGVMDVLAITAGVAVRYAPSMIVGEATRQRLAEGLVVGTRFHSAPVIRLADARPMQLGHTVKADGRWRLFVFAPAEESVSRVGALCAFLAEAPRSPIRRHTPAGAEVDEVIDVRAVFQQGYRALAIEAMPAFLTPSKGRYGLRDYEKLFCADPTPGSDIFDLRRIDRPQGCVVLVRPDQFVAEVLPIEAHEEIAAFFDRFMLEPNRSAHVERA